MNDLVLGLDVSTTEVRVHVLDLAQSASVLGASAPLPPVEDIGAGREQNADYAALAVAAIERAVATAARGRRVSAIAITTTSGTIVPLDDRGRQRGPARMYDDSRNHVLDRSLQEHSGGRPVAMLARAQGMGRVASVADVIGGALVGEPVPGDSSHFLKAGIDASTAAWDDALLRAAGIPPEFVPTLVHPGTVVGSVRHGPARGAMLVAGMTDGCTSQLATGAIGEGDSVGVIGTTFVLKVVETRDRHDSETGVYAHRAPDGLYWSGGASNVGGGSFVLPAGATWAELDRRARAAGPTVLVRYPLMRRGERFPIADACLEPLCVDLDGRPAAFPVDPTIAYRSMMEGVALVERLALETLGIDPGDRIRTLSGGSTRSSLWTDIRAATLGTAVRIPGHHDSGHGAALLAAWRATGDPFAEVVGRHTVAGTVHEPDAALVRTSAERYATFLQALAS